MAMADVSEFPWLKGPPMGSEKVAGSPEVWTSGKWISYEGAWKEGLQHGRGILTDKRGMVRVTRVDGSRSYEKTGWGWGEKGTGTRFCDCK